MRTDIQDSTIPIYIILQYRHYLLKFPVNPNNLTKEITSESETVDIEGLGEVSIPTTPKLSKISINSFFWANNPDIYSYPSAVYINWLERWQRSKEVANLIVTKLNYNMKVTCENFRHWINAGEEDDIYFELTMREYRSYGARKLGVATNKNLISVFQNTLDEINPPMLIEIPRPARYQNKPEVTNPYIVVENDTLITITKMITGSTDDWKSLYNENIGTLGKFYSENGIIPVGTPLIIPSNWIVAYNITNLLEVKTV